jgi:hypothetical protein
VGNTRVGNNIGGFNKTGCLLTNWLFLAGTFNGALSNLQGQETTVLIGDCD